MLPTYPNVVSQRAELNKKLMKQLVSRKAPMLASIGSHLIHEGSGTEIVRPDGTVDPTPMQTLSAEVDLDKMTLDEFTEEVLHTYIDQMADQFARSQSEHMIQVLSDGVEKVGNVVDGEGKPLSPEMLLEACEKLHIDFDENGNWKPPTMIVSPETGARLEKERASFETPEYQQKLKALIDRKRDEYRRREAGRVLAG